MAGLVPAIHALLVPRKKGVDARNKCGHHAECVARLEPKSASWSRAPKARLEPCGRPILRDARLRYSFGELIRMRPRGAAAYRFPVRRYAPSRNDDRIKPGGNPRAACPRCRVG